MTQYVELDKYVKALEQISELRQSVEALLDLYNSGDITSETNAATKRRAAVWEQANNAMERSAP